ncbi:FitA-like ribbon-helix-helix domain-containing protein [Ramlibacter albus]|uniref:Antitoxin FitA-like ribbon-helix-helix domain-containing protein n=1 Tax=Ramlibacter albus TaxID=2079448 RepID=A0A923M7Y5_9BURK|nr:hypothetical protein [Ramlibacter albus]MBC5764439.1 hypothetical protein [Ramlibacter albus]
MAAISIRGLDEKALARLKHRAQRERISLNALAVRLLEGQGSARPEPPKPRTYDDLDSLAGTWKAADAKAFEEAIAPFCEVDESLWK